MDIINDSSSPVSSENIPLAPKKLFVLRVQYFLRAVGFSFLFLLILLFYGMYAFNGSAFLSFVPKSVAGIFILLFGIFIIWSLVCFGACSFFTSVWRRKFYFKCDVGQVELRAGVTNSKTVIIPYGNVKAVNTVEEIINLSRYGLHGRMHGKWREFPQGIYDIVINTMDNKSYRIGGFTQEDAQRIADFISTKINAN